MSQTQTNTGNGEEDVDQQKTTPEQPYTNDKEERNIETSSGDNDPGDNTDRTPYMPAQLEITNSPPSTDRQTPRPYDSVNRSPTGSGESVSLTKETPDKSDALYLEKSPASSKEDIENAIANAEEVENNDVPYSNRSDVPESILPKRYVLLLMIFLGFAVVYSLRVNINVAIVAMVNNRTRITKSGKIAVYVSYRSYSTQALMMIVFGFTNLLCFPSLFCCFESYMRPF